MGLKSLNVRWNIGLDVGLDVRLDSGLDVGLESLDVGLDVGLEPLDVGLDVNTKILSSTPHTRVVTSGGLWSPEKMDGRTDKLDGTDGQSILLFGFRVGNSALN